MTIPIHTLYWPNMDMSIVEAHQAHWQRLGLPVEYTIRKVASGVWLQEVLERELRTNDAVAFADIDALAYSRDAVEELFAYVAETRSFLGLAQSANHLQPVKPVYAAPSFMIVSRYAYEALGRPDLRMRGRFDAAQKLSTTADAMGFAYRVLYPIGFHLLPESGPWRLGNFGHYGIGTEYAGGIFHLFESRRNPSIALFLEKAKRMAEGEPQPLTCPFMSQALSAPREASHFAGSWWRQVVRKAAASF
jgi:hypothetical protein